MLMSPNKDKQLSTVALVTCIVATQVKPVVRMRLVRSESFIFITSLIKRFIFCLLPKQVKANNPQHLPQMKIFPKSRCHVWAFHNKDILI